MNIIVIGIGKVGYTVAEQLTQEGHDVTIIDTDESVINDTLQDIDVIGIIGSGSTSKTLKYAGVLGIGIQDSLKNYCPKGIVGSWPTTCTILN